MFLSINGEVTIACCCAEGCLPHVVTECNNHGISVHPGYSNCQQSYCLQLHILCYSLISTLNEDIALRLPSVTLLNHADYHLPINVNSTIIEVLGKEQIWSGIFTVHIVVYLLIIKDKFSV